VTFRPKRPRTTLDMTDHAEGGRVVSFVSSGSASESAVVHTAVAAREILQGRALAGHHPQRRQALDDASPPASERRNRDVQWPATGRRKDRLRRCPPTPTPLRGTSRLRLCVVGILPLELSDDLRTTSRFDQDRHVACPWSIAVLDWCRRKSDPRHDRPRGPRQNRTFAEPAGSIGP
jgi:hypothetical protein